jgi:pyruvate formate lyase activating enzyme
MMDTGWDNIKSIVTSSMVDWPGKISMVLFMGGCNLRCPTCHNYQIAWSPETVDTIPKSRVENVIRNNEMWYDGIVITGGEPTIDEGLVDILTDIKHITDLPIKVDSNGMRPDILKTLIDTNLVSQFAVDIKGPVDVYPKLCGNVKDIEFGTALLETLQLADTYPDMFYFRTTKVPVVDNPYILEVIASMVPAGCKHYWQDYRQPE